MFVLYADKNRLTVRKREALTSGSVNVNTVRFEFSAVWAGLAKTAVFRCSSGATVEILLDKDSQCLIPWEVLASHGQRVSVGVYGSLGSDIVLPTILVDLGVVVEGAAPSGDQFPPTPGLYEQILAVLTKKQDKLTGLPGQIVSFDRDGNAVARDMPAGGESNGTGESVDPGGDPDIATDQEIDEMLGEVFGPSGK